MIVRIVKMSFDPEKVNEFLEVFNSAKHQIRSFNGCSRLELLNDINHNHIYFTYSYWDSPEALGNYRQSELFKTTWAKTKILFIAPPEAWSNRVVG